jgi:hypothetical protein
MSEQDNLKLWNSVQETDPAKTKEVSYGKRKFTALDAYTQIRRATELWGPVGIGWGWDAEFSVCGDVCIATIQMWHGDRANAFTTVGSSKVGNDGEAPKKALTDGITKGLSYLGFNADVFLGKFEDSKYVAEMRKKHQPEMTEEEKINGAWAKTCDAFGEAVAQAVYAANQFPRTLDGMRALYAECKRQSEGQQNG